MRRCKSNGYILRTATIYLYSSPTDSSILPSPGPSFLWVLYSTIQSQRGSEGLKHLREGQIPPFHFSMEHTERLREVKESALVTQLYMASGTCLWNWVVGKADPWTSINCSFCSTSQISACGNQTRDPQGPTHSTHSHYISQDTGTSPGSCETQTSPALTSGKSQGSFWNNSWHSSL